ncbi:amino acid adenylation domain-containing protein [Vallitalea pronyensis]|uniref:Amino acid adenylation domain-containing protein n=1 Tax=Vallitalea pronyensis TaxID=1348613 RepID=A0A8J8SFM7_9FIRM|nr:amino acid adenylation domain-containing protein [Vallitalea pronyensis]QUI21850.1 amino acid adenylation domain-containing protein [Vallitalea pronyensis]
MQGKNIYHLLQENQRLGAEAIICGDTQIEYRDFIQQVDNMANQLSRVFNMNNRRCIILLERSPELLMAIFATLKIGIAYVPIDPVYPQEQMRTMINNIGQCNVITMTKYKQYFEDTNIFYMDSRERYVGQLHEEKKTEYDANDLAYIIYTSGTTGVPNAIGIFQRSVINLIEGLCEVIHFSQGKTIACLTSCSFDIFVVETILALCKGLKVVMANEKEQGNPKLMSKLIHENKIDMIQLTPSTMQMLVNYDQDLMCLKGVSDIMLGGEVLTSSLLELLKSKTNAKIYNMYGPTETTVWSSVSNLTGKNNVDIGKPIKNTEVYIVDDDLNEIKDGHVGEICIAGAGLAMGYINNKALTDKRFVRNKIDSKRMYRTGDYGYIVEDGYITYVGRKDNQVKLRGFRVELERIESVASDHCDINQAVAVIIQSKRKKHDDILCLYFTSHIEIKQDVLKEHLTKRLPEHMIPNKLIQIDKIPMTPNNKINRKALSNIEIYMDDALNDSYNMQSDISKKIIKIISSTTGIRQTILSKNPETAEVGLNSIVFIKVVVKIEEDFNIEFSDDMLDFSKFKDISSIVQYIERCVLDSKRMNENTH